MFKKILIANRGEIAVRIIRACKEIGIKTVSVFSDADRESLHVKYADEAVYIGKPLSRKSYLNQAKIIEVAKEMRAEAIHPGYGFLSENETFARTCRDNRLVFIGPSPECIAMAGNKAAAKKIINELGVPIIPGSEGVISSEKEAFELAYRMGYPVIIKAAGGGGGRGIRIIHDSSELSRELKVASGEARAAFGNPDVYIEKYLVKPRHIEIQILGDQYGNYVYLGERECSIQKRYQKLVEEAPSPFIDEALRRKMGETAISIARAISYTNAGTMEFLVDAQKKFYFMEVNSRIQVEHPVTEMITGVDLVRQQILIATGARLELEQSRVRLEGWAIECRINAEDPENNFLPSPGVVRNLILPGGPGVRVDTHIYENYEVPPFYDSLICKLIVWGRERERAIKRMQRALSEFQVDGIHVTIPFCKKVLAGKDFFLGNIDTQMLERLNNTP